MIQPEGSILDGKTAHPHKTEGIGIEKIPPFLKKLKLQKYKQLVTHQPLHKFALLLKI